MKPKKGLDSFWHFIILTAIFLFLAILSAGFIWHDWKKLHEIDAGQIILIGACIFAAYVYFLWAKLLRKSKNRSKTLLEEKSAKSLRTAYVADDGNLVYFNLMPRDWESLLPKGKTKVTPKDFDWALRDSSWLYRHLMSPSEEKQLKDGPPCLEQDLKAMVFERPPTFKLIWADSGNSVALLLDDEPWAFIHQEGHKGYSKGILKSQFGNPWNQELFEKTFKNESS